MPDPRCPTCHSKIGTNSTVEAERIQGTEGTDTNGNPVPRWTDDPLFTARGFNGTVYGEKRNKIRVVHIKELQDDRKTKEAEAGLSEAQKTTFSDITSDHHILRRHIIELRESTEKLLNSADATLEDYFKLDEEGNEQPQNPKLGSLPQAEWIDVNRGEEYTAEDGTSKSEFTLPDNSVAQSPTLPRSTKIRAIHIEDLRHPIPEGGIPALLGGIVGSRSGPAGTFGYLVENIKGRKVKVVDFKEVDFCGDAGVP